MWLGKKKREAHVSMINYEPYLRSRCLRKERQPFGGKERISGEEITYSFCFLAYLLLDIWGTCCVLDRSISESHQPGYNTMCFCGCCRLKQGNIKEAVPLDLLGATNYKTCAGAGWKIHSAPSPALLLFAYGCYNCRCCILLPNLSPWWCLRVAKVNLSGCLSPR